MKCEHCNKEFITKSHKKGIKHCSKKCAGLCSLKHFKGSKYNLGSKYSDERKKKMSVIAKTLGLKPPSRTGVSPWNKDKLWSEETKTKMRKPHNITQETHQKMSDRAKSRTGANSSNWQGGLVSGNAKIRCSVEYKLWRIAVFERDNYQCIWGGKEHGSKLNADHIKPFAHYPELRFAIDNGRTLCVECHKTTDSYLNNSKNKK